MSESKSPEDNVGEVNPSEGDFVGRDNNLFQGGPIPEDELLKRRLRGQIERLRKRITRLIPVEDALSRLDVLRIPQPIGREIDFEILPFPSFRYRDRGFRPSETNSPIAEGFLEQLREIEEQIRSVAVDGDEELPSLLSKLSVFIDEVNSYLAREKSIFVNSVHSVADRRQLVVTMISTIGRQRFKEEAQNVHLAQISDLMEKLNDRRLTAPDFDILSDEATEAVETMIAIEERRLVVEHLVRVDRSRGLVIIASVVLYILLVLSPLIGVYGDLGLILAQKSLLGVPGLVIVWGLMGGLTAMIIWFTINPTFGFIANLQDAVKCFVMRPLLGVILASAAYLILHTSATLPYEMILVLCLLAGFLAGFSDRFVVGAHHALARKLQPPPSPQPPPVGGPAAAGAEGGQSQPPPCPPPPRSTPWPFPPCILELKAFQSDLPLPYERERVRTLLNERFDLTDFTLFYSRINASIRIPSLETDVPLAIKCQRLVEGADHRSKLGELSFHLARYWVEDMKGECEILVECKLHENLGILLRTLSDRSNEQETADQVQALLERILAKYPA